MSIYKKCWYYFQYYANKSPDQSILGTFALRLDLDEMDDKQSNRINGIVLGCDCSLLFHLSKKILELEVNPKGQRDFI